MPFLPITELTPCAVEWLWPGRLPLGYLCMFDGDPRLGKSVVTLDIAARVTSGQPFPDGAPGVEPANVVLINAEDGNRDVVYGRLQAAGADLNRVIVWQRGAAEPWLRWPADPGRIEDVITRSNARYVVLDPIMAFLDKSVAVASDQSVRQALVPLADLAARRRCVIVLIRHLAKSHGGQALYGGVYSIAFVAACRVAWLVGADPAVRGQMVLAQVKNNLDGPQPSLAYGIERHPSGAARVTWHGPSTWRDDDLLASPSSRRILRLRAQAFLARFLKDGPRNARDIWEAARAQGLSERALRRARKELSIVCQKINAFTPKQAVYWCLPGQHVPKELYTKPGEAEVDAWLRSLDEQQPRRSPLEEEKQP